MSQGAVNQLDDDALSDLLRSAGAGSAEALGDLIGSQQEYLLLIATSELAHEPGNTHSPSDVVQWTALEAVRDFQRFRGQTAGDFRFWLRRILLNNLADHRRRVRPQQLAIPADFPARDRTPSSLVAADEDRRALCALIDTLPADEQQVILLRYFERKSYLDISRRIGRTPEATRKLWSRALVRLHGKLARNELAQ
jgi:RNA polymerase sigma-70 factor (ECF subfamily)